MPLHVVPIGIIPVGYPAERPAKYRRRSLTEVVHIDQWENEAEQQGGPDRTAKQTGQACSGIGYDKLPTCLRKRSSDIWRTPRGEP